MDQRYILGLLAGLIVGWFAVGYIYNLRHGEAVLRWMRGGLPRLGERSTLQWLGTSVAKMVIERAKPPYRRTETLLVLAPRDAAWLWLWARLRGRRDTVIYRFTPVAPPRVAIELSDPASWTGRPALEQATRQGWERQDFPWPGPAASVLRSETATLAGARTGAGPIPTERPLVLMVPQGLMGRAHEVLPYYASVISRLGVRPWRFAVRRDPPLLELHVPFPDTRRADAAAYFEALHDLGKDVESRV